MAILAKVPKHAKAEMLLENTEHALQHAFSFSHLLVLTINQDGVITYCNSGLLKNLKKQEYQLIEKSIFDIFEFDLPDESGFFPENETENTFEGRVIRQSWPKLTVRFDTVYHKKGDEYTGMTLIGENITEKVNVEKALVESNTQLKELFDNSNDLIQIFNTQGSLLFVNEAWKIRLGYQDDDLRKLKLKDIVHPEALKETGRKLKSIEKGEHYERIETVLVSKYGKKIYVTGNINCTVKEGQPSEFRAIFFDITERIRAERAQSLYYKIANLTIRSPNLEILYKNVFNLLNEVLGVKNMAVALKQPDKTLEFPYYVNELNKGSKHKAQLDIATMLSNYTFERKKPLIIYDDGIQKIASTKGITISDTIPKIWMAVLIHSEESEIGAISIHSNEERQSYNFKDLELLDFIASQISLAIERKWNEAKIKNQGARIKAIFESSTHQIWSLDRELKFTSFNQNYSDALQEYYGTTPKLGMRMDQISSVYFSATSKKEWINRYERVFAGEEMHFQTMITSRSGAKIWRDVFLNPIYLPDGSIEEISAIANDITEKKLAEDALLVSEEKFRNIFESFQDIYFQCDLNGHLTLVSPSAKSLLGFDESDYVGKHITQFFAAKNYLQLLRRLFKDGEVRNFDATATSKDLSSIHLLCNIRIIHKKGAAIGIEGVARDITQLKQANEELINAKLVAERSLRVKERFLANMSHEIRTPMNGIIGMIDLIASTKLNKEQLEYIKTIKKSSDTLLHILNDILDLSKIEAGKMELRKSPVKLAKTIEKLYALYSQEAHRNNTSLYYHLGKDLPEWNMIDETRLLQVLSNLTSNAIKFSDGKGNINISIRLIKKLTDTRNLFKAEIKDAGIGISKENIQKLFETFSQVDNSFTKNYSGTGLGLAISKELVKSMNGKIGVASTPGLGSTFWFTFEAEEATPADMQMIEVREEPLLARQFMGTIPKILLVDDNAINRRVASQILKKAGCAVDTADSGKRAIALAKQNTYDLIFMDIQMPMMDGIETTHILKALDLGYKAPIVAMTAYSMEEDRDKFLNQGLDDYIPKPIKAHHLVQKVKDWIGFDAKHVQPEILNEVSKDLIINQNTLNQLFKYGGEEIINSVLEEFDTETDNLLKTALTKQNENDFDEVRSILHTLKGNAGTLGVERLWRQVESAEAKLKVADYSQIEKDLKRIIRLYDEFKRNYKSIVKA